MLAQPQAPARTRLEILISGFGGQGVVRMGQILGLTAIEQGHKVTMLKSHGTETRGGYVRAQVVISPTEVDSPVVERADYFVAFSLSAYNRFFDLVGDGGTVLYDPEMVPNIPQERLARRRHLAVPATRLAKDRLKNAIFANMIMLGALARAADLGLDAVKRAMRRSIPRFHDQNDQALDLGYTLVSG